MKARTSVVVIGGGIAGLAAAWELSGGASGPTKETPRIELFESAPVVGGNLAVIDAEGQSLDAGADGFLARRPEAAQLIGEVGRGDDLIPIAASGAWLHLAGRLEPIPEQSVLGVPTSAKSLRPLQGLSSRARRAAWRDEHVPHRFTPGDDETIGAIVRAKLGDEIALHVVEPLVGGIQAGRIDDLSAAAVFPALLSAAARRGSLMRAIRPPATASDSSRGPMFLTLRRGLGSLPATVRDRLVDRGVIVTVGARVVALRRAPTNFYSWEVDTATSTTPANALVVATPAPEVARLVGNQDPALASLADVVSASCAIVTMTAPRDAVQLPATGTGVLIPLGTAGPAGPMVVTAVTLLDRKWPHLARDGRVLVRCHVGRSDDHRAVAMSDDDLVARVRTELRSVLHGWPLDGAATVARFPDALPQYRIGHVARVAAARVAAQSRHVLLAGSAYDGVGVPASIGSGRRAGSDALAMLG